MEDLKTKAKYDLFSKGISLYFRGSDYYSTLFGKIATFVYIMLYFILLVYYSLLGILKKKCNLSSQEAITEQLPNLTLNKNNLYFTFSLEDPNTYDNFRDDEIYYTEAYYKHGKRVGSNWIWEQKQLEVGPCEVEYFGEKYKELLKLKPYKSYTCIKNLTENLFGNFVYDDYSFIYIKFFPCINDTTHHCKSQEIIDKYLNGTFVDFQMQSVLLNFENYKNPVIENFEDIYSTVGRGFKRELHILFKIINFKDYGFFGQSLSEKKFIQYDRNNPMVTLNLDSQKNKSICDVTIKLSDKTLIIKREYFTLIDIFSKLGGIMELILKIITVILFFPVTAFFDINVINELFQFDEKSKETLCKGIKNQCFFRAGSVEYHNKIKNSTPKNEYKRVKSVFEKKFHFNNKQKQPKSKFAMVVNRNVSTRNITNSNFNSKDFILNNIISNISQVKNNIENVNNYGSINKSSGKKSYPKKVNIINNNQPMDESKIIKVIKMSNFNLCLFSLFPNKFINKNSSLLKIGLLKFREELDVAKLFRVGLLNNRATEILKKNCSLLSFDKEDLVINTDALYSRE